MNNVVSRPLRARLLAAACAAACTVPAFAADVDRSAPERIDRESSVAVGKQMLAADPAALAATMPPASSAEARFRAFARTLPSNQRSKLLTAEGLARTHLAQLDGTRAKRANQGLLQLRNVSSLGNGARIVSFGTQVQGVEVFRRSVSVLIDGEQALRAVSGVWPPVQEPVAAKAALAWKLRAEDALATALAGHGFETAQARAAVRPLRSERGYLHLEVAQSAAGAHGERVHSARSKQVLFPLAGRLIPAWYVETVTGRDGSPDADYYAQVVDAASGEILFRHRQSEDANFQWNVWADSTAPYTPYASPHGQNDLPQPFNVPTGTIPATAGTNVVTLQNAPYSRNDAWLPGAATVTTGNNAEAYIDLNNDGFEAAFDFRSPVFPESGPAPGAYDPTLDPAATQAQREAAVRQMFYLVNWTHDWYYDSGFDEAAGNAQDDNFGRGGLGGDSIRAEGQDNTDSPGIACAPDCLNNANMATPADGGRPRMQMYIYSPTGNASFTQTAPFNAAYAAGRPTWSTAAFDVSAPVVRALDDAGNGSGTDGCTAFSNAAEVAGKIAFVDRGNCDFVVKTQRAIDAGAVGVLIGNVPGSGSASTPPAMGCTQAPCPAPAFPALSLNLADADSLRSALGGGGVAGRMKRESVRPDGTVDNQLMAHELGHYISNRLVENASGLTTPMSRGMGEGWGDFHALLLSVRPEDINLPWNANWSGIYPVATYSTGNFFHGMRRYPYSYNLAVNPLTLKHIQTGIPLPATPAPRFTGDNAEVHNTGEVWASMLWDCYVSLLRAHPFQEAQNRMKQYLIAGYKLTPAAPLITEARDAMLAAAVVNDPADFQRFAAAFTRRGLGIGARTPDRYGSTNAGTVESFITGGRAGFDDLALDDGGSCDDDGILDNGETGVLRLRFENTGWTPLFASSLQISADFPGLTFSGEPLGSTSVPATSAYGGADVQLPVELVGAPANGLVTFTVTAFDPDLSVPSSAQFTVRVDHDDVPASAATETFDASLAPWTPRLTDGANAPKDWRAAQIDGRNVAQGPAIGAPGVAWLESPDIAVGNAPFVVTLSHRHRFETDGTHYDGGVVELSTDGGATWTPVAGSPSVYGGVLSDCCGNPLQGRDAFVGDSAGYPAFATSTLDLGTGYSGQTVRLRFGVAEDEATGTAGWDIDTLALAGATNLPFTRRTWQSQTCPAALTPKVVVSGSPVGAAATINGTATRTLGIGNQGFGNLHWTLGESTSALCNVPADIGWLRVGTVAGTTVVGSTSSVEVTLDATGLAPGTHSARLCIDNNDKTLPRASVPVTFLVTNSAPVFTSTPVTGAVQASAYSYAVIAGDNDPGDTRAITAPTLPAWLLLAPTGNGTATLSGTPQLADVGAHPVVLRVTDANGLFREQAFTITVASNNAAPVAVGTVPAQVDDEGDAVTFDLSGFFDDADAGNTLAYSATGLPPGLALDAATGIVTGALDFQSAGVYPVTVTATDPANATATQTFAWTVNDVVLPPPIFGDGFEGN